jgi:hypothetical protein
MLPAGQSGEVAMKDQEQPAAPEGLEPDLATLRIGDGKGWGYLPDPAPRREIEVHVCSI